MIQCREIKSAAAAAAMSSGWRVEGAGLHSEQGKELEYVLHLLSCVFPRAFHKGRPL